MTEVVEKKGIKETKELAKGVFAVAKLLVERMKDGVGVDDAMAIYAKITADEEFKKKVVDAYEGYGEVGAEIKDIEIEEAFELAGDLLPEVLDLIKSFGK